MCSTLILPPSLIPDVLSKNTVAQAFIIGCDYTYIGIGSDPDDFVWPPRDSDRDGAPDCWDPCPGDDDPLCGFYPDCETIKSMLEIAGLLFGSGALIVKAGSKFLGAMGVGSGGSGYFLDCDEDGG